MASANTPLSQINAAANLGAFLQIVYSDGVINQISEDFRDWEMVSKQKVTDEAARSVNFMVQKSLGVPAVVWSKQGSSGAFPSASQTTNEELSAGFNQMYSTVELEYDVWQRALGSPHKFAEPLALEIQSKAIAQKRLMSAAFHLDGTGDLGTIYSNALSGTEAVFTFSAGGARYIEYGDKISIVNEDGTVVDVGGGSGTITDTYFVVTDKDRENNTVTCAFYLAEVLTTWSDATYGIAGPLTQGDRVYRFGSTTIDKSSTYFTAGTLEVNNMAEIMPGLPSLTATDGRLMHGMTMSGVTKGTKYSASAQAIDISHIQAGLDKLKTITGQGRFKYKQLLCAPETQAAFIESQETDRRLVNINDNKRGQRGFGYVHCNDTLELVTSEFNAAASIWAIPEASKNEGILELHGKDFVEVKAGSQGEFLKSGSSGYEPYIQKFMMAYMTLICKRPSAILEINNFTV